MALTRASSTDRSCAAGEGGRTTRPYTMPGSLTSWTYAAPPVNFLGMSRRATLLPTHT
jgi:hypothetical protein